MSLSHPSSAPKGLEEAQDRLRRLVKPNALTAPSKPFSFPEGVHAKVVSMLTNNRVPDESRDDLAEHRGEVLALVAMILAGAGLDSAFSEDPVTRGLCLTVTERPAEPVRELNDAVQAELLNVLKLRFERHRDSADYYKWSAIEVALQAHPNSLIGLFNLEMAGHEPTFIHINAEGAYVFGTGYVEPPSHARGIHHDRETERVLREKRTDTPVAGWGVDTVTGYAVDLAQKWGVQQMDSKTYELLVPLVKAWEMGTVCVLAPLPDGTPMGGSHGSVYPLKNTSWPVPNMFRDARFQVNVPPAPSS